MTAALVTGQGIIATMDNVQRTTDSGRNHHFALPTLVGAFVFYTSAYTFASSTLYRPATYDSRGSNCSSQAEGDLLIEAIPRVPTEQLISMWVTC